MTNLEVFDCLFLRVVPPSAMGEGILSSLSVVPPSRRAKTTEETTADSQSDPLQGLGDDLHTVSFVDDVAVEIITVTDYAEVELGTSANVEVVMGESCFEGTDVSVVAEEQMVIIPEEAVEEMRGEAGDEVTQEQPESGLTNLIDAEGTEEDPAASQRKASSGPHVCFACKKRFKFASSLIAHRVIHTGERPHRCGECGRCFSFRQSLDRHRHTHKTAKKYDCSICGETFQSLSARTEHKQKHMEDGAYTCLQCSKKFNWELALVRHMKTHTDDDASKPATSGKAEQVAVTGEEQVREAEVPKLDSKMKVGDGENGNSEEAEGQNGDQPTSEPGAEVLKPAVEMVSPVKVRTSGRKRKPTMKIQVINLQKRIGKFSAATTRPAAMVKPTAVKLVPFNR